MNFLKIWSFCMAAASMVVAWEDVRAGTGSLKFTSHVHDFGDVYQGAKVSHKFQFVNSGSGPVAVTGVHAACGCTAVELEKGREYKPGETGDIEVQFDSTDFQGRIVKTITVMTSEKLLPDRVLTLKANVKSELEVMPPLVDFGSVSGGNAGERELKIVPVGAYDLKVAAVEYNKDLLSVVSETKDRTTTLRVRLGAAVPTGFFKESITVRTNSRHMPIVTIPVRGNIKGNVEFSPAYIEFGAIQPNETVKRSVTLKSVTPVNIVSTEAELIVNGQKLQDATNFLKINTAGFEQNKQHIAVEIVNKGAPAGAVHGKLVIRTTDARQQSINVDFYAFFR
jgi:hypothetical protein